MVEEARPRRAQLVAAFAIIYLVWGSTFLAIKIGVAEVPPFLFAAMRFLAAGVLLYGGLRLRGVAAPTGREWGSVAKMAVLVFVVDYGLLFWAHRRVPSGTAALLVATIPLFMTLSEVWILRTARLTLRVAGALLVGLLGVAALVVPAQGLIGEAVDSAGAAALLVAALAWAIASALSRKLPLPADKAMSSGAQMLLGGAMLALAASLLGELRGFEPATVSPAAWWALAYMVVPGSIVAFTAYVWLLHHVSPTKVGTYAYVNPVVAVILGYLFGGESLGPRTLLGAALVLVSVVVLTTQPAARVTAK